MMKIYLSILFCLITVSVFADDDCELYQKSNKSIEWCKKEIEQSKDTVVKNNLQEKVKVESEKAAIYLENCDKLNPSSKPKEYLLRWYKMAKHSIDAQKYDKAKLLLKKCKDHSDAHSVTIEEKPLDKLAEEILLGLERFVKSENPKKIEIIYQGEYTGAQIDQYKSSSAVQKNYSGNTEQ